MAHLASLILLLFTLYPIYFNLDASVRDVTIYNFTSGVHPFVGLHNYLTMLRTGAFWSATGATAIFVFIASWNEFLLASVLTGPHSRTAPVAAAQFSTEYGVEWGPMMAAGTVIIVPMLLAALLVQRYIVRGLTLGAVKG